MADSPQIGSPVRAVFLDRDGVIARRCAAKTVERNRAVAEALGQDACEITEIDEHRLFYKVFLDPATGPIRTLEEEHAFWRMWTEHLLAERGHPAPRDVAAALYERFPLPAMLEPFEEVPDVLDTLVGRGYRLAVISNTFPSLEQTITAIALEHHFEVFVNSAEIGIEKPDAAIYRAAMERLGASPAESVFVDDLLVNVEGAREAGMRAFHLDRKRDAPDWEMWILHDLNDLVTWLEHQPQDTGEE